jgi:hypothetical protein
MPLSNALGQIQFTNIQHIPEKTPFPVKLPRLQSGSHSGKTLGIVNLISINPENPCIGSGKWLDQFMTETGVGSPVQDNFPGKFGLQPFQNSGRSVSRTVVHRDQPIAETDGVADSPLNKKILVFDEKDSHYLHGD